jgi:hypothetical protein
MCAMHNVQLRTTLWCEWDAFPCDSVCVTELARDAATDDGLQEAAKERALPLLHASAKLRHLKGSLLIVAATATGYCQRLCGVIAGVLLLTKRWLRLCCSACRLWPLVNLTK